MPATDPPLGNQSICISVWIGIWMMTIGFLVGAVGCAARSNDPTSRETVRVDYVREIRPLLETQCYACHGPMDVPSGKLRLDERARMIKGGRSGVPAIIPGKGAESPLVIAISGGDDERWRPMPPRGHGLRPEQIRLIRLWIDQGASFETD